MKPGNLAKFRIQGDPIRIVQLWLTDLPLYFLEIRAIVVQPFNMRLRCNVELVMGELCHQMCATRMNHKPRPAISIEPLGVLVKPLVPAGGIGGGEIEQGLVLHVHEGDWGSRQMVSGRGQVIAPQPYGIGQALPQAEWNLATHLTQLARTIDHVPEIAMSAPDHSGDSWYPQRRRRIAWARCGLDHRCQDRLYFIMGIARFLVRRHDECLYRRATRCP